MSTHVLRTREHVCKVMKNPRAREKSFKPGVIQDGWGVGGGILSDIGVLGRNMSGRGGGSRAVNGTRGGDGFASFPRGTW